MVFTEVNPDKGTETNNLISAHLLNKLFTEVNPDKGTETRPISYESHSTYCLQKLTPIRGRKPDGLNLINSVSNVYRS